MKSKTEFYMTIGRELVSTNTKLTVINPANEEVVGEAPECTGDMLNQAVVAAQVAFRGWSRESLETRRKALFMIAEVLEANTKILCEILTSEQGKSLADAAMEIGGAAYWFRETAKLEIKDIINSDGQDYKSVTTYVPLGVVGAIAPWNYPIGLAAFKLSSAILAGNTVILKPSPFTPLATLKMGELLQAVLPPGVLNVLSGSDSLGPLMTSHPDIQKISFTGSSITGRRVMEGAAQSLKRITLELGGNDPLIVLRDVDIEKTAKSIFWAAFSNSGQICLAAKRIYIHSSIYDQFRDALVAIAKTIKMGAGTDNDNQLGPIQNRLQYDRVLGLIQDSVEHGHKFALGGLPEKTKGFFIPVTIVDNPPESSRIVQEEQFGPVLPLMKFDDIDDVVDRANATEYGLGASVWSNDLELATKIANRIQAGTVWVNECLVLSPNVSFAGHKQSGVGCESGNAGLHEYLIPKTVTVRKVSTNNK